MHMMELASDSYFVTVFKPLEKGWVYEIEAVILSLTTLTSSDSANTVCTREI